MTNIEVLELRISEISEELETLRLGQQKVAERIRDLKAELTEVSLDCELLKERTTSPNKAKRVVELKLNLEDYRNQIGNQARIINPKRGEDNIGKVTKVGKLYVLVQLPNGETKRRMASNLRLIKNANPTR